MSVLVITVIIIACLALVIAYVLVMTSSATKGLVKANIRAYFRARQGGATHEKALEWVVYSRYNRFEARRGEVVWQLWTTEKEDTIRMLQDFNPNIGTNNEECELKSLVFSIFASENKPPFVARNGNKVLQLMDTVYESMRSKYLS